MVATGVRGLKLLQLNLWMGRVLPQVLRTIEREQPDIVCLQEVFNADRTVIFPEPMLNGVDDIKQLLGYKYSYFSPVFSIQVNGNTVDFGNAIISRFPLLATKTIFTHGSYVPLDSPARLDNSRNLQLARVEYLPGKTFNLVNHHAHWEKTPAGSDTSVEKMQLVKAAIGQLDGPVILAGDLNVDPGTATLKIFDGSLEDLTASYTIQSTLSLLGKVNNVACDHIFVDSTIQVQSFRVLDDVISDHKALLLEFNL